MEVKEILEKVSKDILSTPTGPERNALCDFEIRLRVMVEDMSKRDPLIKTVTNCPTCGSEVGIGGTDGETHYYIPKK